MKSPFTKLWTGLAQRTSEMPFVRLVGHFVNRGLRGGAESDSEELDLSTGLLLVLLPVPGFFVSVIYYEKYSTLLQVLRRDFIPDPYTASLGDEYLFIVVSMVLTGILGVWRWDSILPDRRDFANLVHLPIAAWKLFLANLCAIFFLTMLFTFEVNIGSTLLFPMVVSSSYPEVSVYAGFAIGHAVSVSLASIFTFTAVVALIGLSMFLFPYRVFRRVSQYLRIALIVFFLSLLMSTFFLTPLFASFAHGLNSFLRFLCPVWFLGVCETLRRSAAPVFRNLSHVAFVSLAAASVLAVVGYSLSYRRCFLSIPETVEPISSRSSFLLRWLLRFANHFYLPTPASRACFGFVLRTLTRSEKHFTALGGFLGLALLLCAQTLITAQHQPKELADLAPSPAALSLPLILIYCFVVGMRFVFEIPADLRSNWVFRLYLDASPGESFILGRALLWTCVAPFLILVCFPGYAYVSGWKLSLLHLAFVSLMASLLIETSLVRLRKIPFTCSLPLFRQDAFVTLFVLFLGYFLFVRVGSFLEYVAILDPIRVILLAFLLGGWWFALRYYRSDILDMDKAVIFEESPTEAVQVLGLHTSR